MSPHEILAARRREPFEPFAICLADGRRFEVAHPHLVMVGPKSVCIGVQSPHHDEGIAERIDYGALSEITRLEPIDG